MNKFNAIAVMVLVLLAVPALAVVDVTNVFNVQSASALAYNCLDAQCNTVGAFSGSFPNGATTTTGSILVRYPTQLAAPNGYAVYFVSPGFVPMEYRDTWFGNGATSLNVNFYQIEMCRSVIDTFTVTNDAHANVPLVIDVSASLDATTRSAFYLTDTGVGYVPPALSDYYSADTRVVLTITNDEGQIVNSQQVDLTGANALFADSSVDLQFSWTPTVSGEYTAEVRTEVIDDQCAATESQHATSEFTVLGALPRNMCYTILNSLAADPIVGIVGEEVTLDFDKISNHANDYPWNDPSFTLTPVATDLTSQITGPTTSTDNMILPANPDAVDPVGYTLQFTPEAEGMYEVILTGIASSPLCAGLENVPNTVTLNVYAQNPPTYCLNFQIVSGQTGAPIAGATINVGGQTVVTNANGQVSVCGLEPGDYTYTVSAPGFVTAQGVAHLVDVSLDIALALQPEQNGEDGAVHFVVRNAYTQAPIAGATVAFQGGSQLTNVNGLANWYEVPAGNHAWAVTAAGYNAANGNVQTDGVNDVTVYVALVPVNDGENHTITFHVYDADTGANLLSALARLTGNGLPPNGLEGLTSVLGLTSFVDMAQGVYSWAVSLAGYLPAVGGVTLGDDDVTIEVALQREGDICETRVVTFTVLDDVSGDPIEDATVRIGSQTRHTDENGQVRFWLCDGSYSYRVTADGYLGGSGIVTVSGGDVNVVVRLGRGPDWEGSDGQLGIFVGSIRIPEIPVDALDVPILITVKNEGDGTLEGVRLTAVSTELGIRGVEGPLDLHRRDRMTLRIMLPLENVQLEEGLYPIRLVISNDDMHRVIYRDLEVFS